MPLAEYEADAEDLAWAKGLCKAAAALPPGPERTARVTEAQFFMDALALFPGVRILDGPAEETPAPPLSDPAENTVGKFHRGAGETEVAAAVRTFPGSGTQRRRVLDAIAEGFDGLIDEEIAAVDGINDTAHRTRRNELVQGGWVEDSGRIRQTASGSDSIVWVLADQAQAEYAKLPGARPRFVDEAAAIHHLVEGWDDDPEQAPLWAQESLL